MHSCHLIVDSAADGAWNMAVDEAMLETAKHTGIAMLRFYSWREPTLSLGYFQGHGDRGLHPASSNCPLVRRASGGGAILHDRELTYSVALPQLHPAAAQNQRLYLAFHQTLIETLSDFGIHSSLVAPNSSNQPRQPFLCFQRRASGDVVLGNYKIAGSAQRRHHQAILQHGSILLEQSAFAPELPGIRDVAGKQLDREALQSAWVVRIARQLELDLIEMPRAEALRDRAEAAMAKFRSTAWNLRR